MGNTNQTARNTNVRDPRERIYKLIIIGSPRAGKTAVLKRYVNGAWDEPYDLIGTDFRIKRIVWTTDLALKLQIWDTVIHERFSRLTRVYYARSSGVIICFDITDRASFDEAKEWKEKVDAFTSTEGCPPIPTILLATKCDLLTKESHELLATLDSFCKEYRFSSWFMTSSKDDMNIKEAFNYLVATIIANDAELAKLPIS